ncbi:flagellin [Desulfosarcina ovata subsp. sediminis]|uniref:Flagellin n=1 Tax=Desulfosarcina ovata subsp. sediminis TaxID=885957 RepID=A0A5K7ZC99_9BACT|nr:flagellin [Desulfosarcina ovata]BBO79788.1 flagellin [Desulfosarcina ovata subsp. sediminis]
MSITLTAGMRSNLTALQTTNDLMELTQNRLSTGKEVNTALDDPVNFFKAKDHSDRASDLEAKKDGMAESIKTIEAADTGIEAIYDLLDQMESLASAAKTSDNTGDLQDQYDKLMTQISTLALDSKYGGNNLMNGDTISVEFDESGDHTLNVGTKNLSATTAGIVAGATLHGGNFDTQESMSSAITEIDAAVSNLRTEAQKLASSLSTISIREDFTESMINTLETGADDLTLADMNEEGANMLMLQTRQQLGTSSLSMSSEAAQSVLQLF